MLGIASSTSTSPSHPAAKAEASMLTRCAPIRDQMQPHPSNSWNGYRKSCALASVTFVTPLPVIDRRGPLTYSSRKLSDSVKCSSALSATCSASGQTQTITRQAPTITKAPTREPAQTPKIDDGGPGLPPGDDGGGGGGGGGGGNWSGGFFFFGFLAFLGFLKDKEGEEDANGRSRR